MLQNFVTWRRNEAPRLLGSVELAPVAPPEPPVKIEGAPLLLYIEDEPVPEHTAFTLKCTVEAMLVGPVRGEERVPIELKSVAVLPPDPVCAHETLRSHRRPPHKARA